MNIQYISLTLCAALALGLASCGKNEPVTATAEDAAKATGSTSGAARVEGANTAAAKTEAAKTAHNSMAQELIDKAKGLVAENKFSDASSVLQQLTGQSLSEEQTKLVDGLKEQIQKALVAKAAENATGIGGDLLKK